MTREEAIERLKDGAPFSELLDVKWEEAINMAIEALEQEPKENEVILTNSEYRDLISNEYDHGYCKGYTEALEEQKSILDEIRAEIEPKCDRINSLASVLPYTAHREIQELLCEIMNLCKAESEDKE